MPVYLRSAANGELEKELETAENGYAFPDGKSKAASLKAAELSTVAADTKNLAHA